MCDKNWSIIFRKFKKIFEYISYKKQKKIWDPREFAVKQIIAVGGY